MGSTPSSNPSMSGSGDVVGLDTLLRLPGKVVLPPVGSEAAYSQRHEVNPAIALNLINDIQTVVVRYRDQLREIAKALHVMQAQGPMVDGWLESSADVGASAAAATILRHGDADVLMQYIESLDAVPPNEMSSETVAVTEQAPAASESLSAATAYRLCYLNENGQVQSQPCPPEQMGLVSVAIARYQNYKQLLSQQQAVEAKLKAVVAQLGQVRETLMTE